MSAVSAQQDDNRERARRARTRTHAKLSKTGATRFLPLSTNDYRRFSAAWSCPLPSTGSTLMRVARGVAHLTKEAGRSVTVGKARMLSSSLLSFGFAHDTVLS